MNTTKIFSHFSHKYINTTIIVCLLKIVHIFGYRKIIYLEHVHKTTNLYATNLFLIYHIKLTMQLSFENHSQKLPCTWLKQTKMHLSELNRYTYVTPIEWIHTSLLIQNYDYLSTCVIVHQMYWLLCVYTIQVFTIR